MSGQVQEQAEVMGRGEQEGAFSDEQVPLPRCWLEMTREDPADDLTPALLLLPGATNWAGGQSTDFCPPEDKTKDPAGTKPSVLGAAKQALSPGSLQSES